LSRRFDTGDAGDHRWVGASSIGLAGSLVLAAYLSSPHEHLLRNIIAKLKLEALGRRSDPLTHGTSNVLLKN
jgi:hypothetical protein